MDRFIPLLAILFVSFLAIQSKMAKAAQAKCADVTSAVKIQDGVYVRPSNNGIIFEDENIANIGFIIGDKAIAVIDTGLFYGHEDIKGNKRILPGFDFISDVRTAKDGDGIDNDPTDPGTGSEPNTCPTRGAEQDGWHGTHVAGLAGAVGRQAHGAGLILQGGLDGLPDPPHGVGHEAELTAFVETACRGDQPHIAFGDQVHVAQAAVQIAFGHANDKTQIGSG